MSNKTKKATGGKLPLSTGIDRKTGTTNLTNKQINEEYDQLKADRSVTRGTNSPWFIKICLN